LPGRPLARSWANFTNVFRAEVGKDQYTDLSLPVVPRRLREASGSHIRQSAPGYGDENANVSGPELQDLKASVKTVSAFGDFSTIGFAMIGLGEVTYGISVSFRLISFCNSD